MKEVYYTSVCTKLAAYKRLMSIHNLIIITLPLEAWSDKLTTAIQGNQVWVVMFYVYGTYDVYGWHTSVVLVAYVIIDGRSSRIYKTSNHYLAGDGVQTVLPDLWQCAGSITCPATVFRPCCVTWPSMGCRLYYLTCDSVQAVLCYLPCNGVQALLPDLRLCAGRSTWPAVTCRPCYLTCNGVQALIPDLRWCAGRVTWPAMVCEQNE